MKLFGRELILRKPQEITSVVPKVQAQTRNPASYRLAWEAANINRLNSSFYVLLRSPNYENQFDILRLRGMARFMYKNDAYVGRYTSLLETNVIGPKGIQLDCRYTLPDGTQNKEVNEAVEKAWEDWCHNHAMLDGSLTFHELEMLEIKTCAVDGEGWIRLVTSPELPYGLALMPYDADQFDVNYSLAQYNEGRMIWQACELDSQTGAITAYHPWNKHPETAQIQGIKRIVVPADEMIHLYRQERPTMLRGIPWIAVCLNTLSYLHEFITATLVSAQVDAANLGTINTPKEDASAYLNPGTSDVRGETVDLQVGTLLRLAPGETATMLDSKRPNPAFGPFLNSIVHMIASALNVSYASLASDQSQENYSSGRIGLLNERDEYRKIQSWMIKRFHKPIFKAWLKTAIETGALKIPADAIADDSAVIWRTRDWSQADPLKELQAWQGAIRLNLTSKQAVSAENGADYFDILAERIEEERAEREAEKQMLADGLPPIVSPPATTTALVDTVAEPQGPPPREPILSPKTE